MIAAATDTTKIGRIQVIVIDLCSSLSYLLVLKCSLRIVSFSSGVLVQSGIYT